MLAIYKSCKTGQPVKLPLKDFASEDMKGMFGNGKPSYMKAPLWTRGQKLGPVQRFGTFVISKAEPALERTVLWDRM